MANFNVQFLDLDDDLSLFTQEDKPERNINDVAIDNMEELLYLSIDSTFGSLASF